MGNRSAIARRALLCALPAAASLGTALVSFPARGSLESLFAPGKDLWPRWQASDETSTLAIDHAGFALFLERHLRPFADGIARIAYRKVTPADRAALLAYADRLAGVAVGRLARAEQLAYWINLYNALTITVVLDRYPVASIRDIDISPGLFSSGPWGKKLVTIDGEGVSLNDIEHRILRPIWNDPRLHYALNCASLGCPNLQPRPFTAATAPATLEAAARTFVNHPRGARIERGRLVASKIYDWFREDFGGSSDGVIAHLVRYADPPLVAALAGRRSVDDHEYDWRLNDVPA